MRGVGWGGKCAQRLHQWCTPLRSALLDGEKLCVRQEDRFDPSFDSPPLIFLIRRSDWKATPFASDAVKEEGGRADRAGKGRGVRNRDLFLPRGLLRPACGLHGCAGIRRVEEALLKSTGCSALTLS